LASKAAGRDARENCGKGGNQIDNKSAISLVKNPVHHDRRKHIDVRFHFPRECAQDGLIEVDFIRTEDQLADTMTRPLCWAKFERL
jgi:hypothetical protein